jgi:hypothetical protein
MQPSYVRVAREQRHADDGIRKGSGADERDVDRELHVVAHENAA